MCEYLELCADIIQSPIELAKKFRQIIPEDDKEVARKLYVHGVNEPSDLYSAMWESIQSTAPIDSQIDDYLRLVFCAWSEESKVSCVRFAKTLVTLIF